MPAVSVAVAEEDAGAERIILVQQRVARARPIISVEGRLVRAVEPDQRTHPSRSQDQSVRIVAVSVWLSRHLICSGIGR
jgi:hypothetical protein